MNGLRSGIIGAVFTASVLVPVGLRMKVNADRDIGIERANHDALQDTLRRVTLGINVLAKDVQAYQRKAVQKPIARDRFDLALHQETKGKVEIALTIPQVDTTVRGVSTNDSGDVRDISFQDIPAGPFRISAEITSPPAPQEAIGTFHIALVKPTPIEVRLSCGEPDRLNNGMKPAQVNVNIPKWTHPDVSIPMMDPDVCNPKKENWAADPKTWVLSLGLLIAFLRH